MADLFDRLVDLRRKVCVLALLHGLQELLVGFLLNQFLHARKQQFGRLFVGHVHGSSGGEGDSVHGEFAVLGLSHLFFKGLRKLFGQLRAVLLHLFLVNLGDPADGGSVHAAPHLLHDGLYFLSCYADHLAAQQGAGHRHGFPVFLRAERQQRFLLLAGEQAQFDPVLVRGTLQGQRAEDIADCGQRVLIH